MASDGLVLESATEVFAPLLQTPRWNGERVSTRPVSSSRLHLVFILAARVTMFCDLLRGVLFISRLWKIRFVIYRNSFGGSMFDLRDVTM